MNDAPAIGGKLAEEAGDVGDPVPILDGASSQPIQCPPELEAEVKIACDPLSDLDERLEAFENVLESEVGDTRLARARNIERETAVNEPLINSHSIDGDLALDAIRSTFGWASYASDRAMSNFSRLVSTSEGLSVLPASTAGLIALLDGAKKSDLANDRYVVILTGRR
jgi:hypothetical protein